MGLPTKIINIRLSPGQKDRFDRLKGEFAGLPQATILRLLINAFLEMPIDKQVEILTKQIRKPGTDTQTASDVKNRLNANSKRVT